MADESNAGTDEVPVPDEPTAEGETLDEAGDNNSQTKEFGDDLARWKHFARKNETDAKAMREEVAGLRTELEQYRQAAMTEAEKAIETARSEARAEAMTVANGRLVNAAILAAATGRLADPSDALALLDLSTFEVSDDGTVDSSAVETALSGLLESKPHLAAGGTKPSSLPGATASNKTQPPSVNDLIRRAAGVTPD